MTTTHTTTAPRTTSSPRPSRSSSRDQQRARALSELNRLEAEAASALSRRDREALTEDMRARAQMAQDRVTRAIRRGRRKYEQAQEKLTREVRDHARRTVDVGHIPAGRGWFLAVEEAYAAHAEKGRRLAKQRAELEAKGPGPFIEESVRNALVDLRLEALQLGGDVDCAARGLLYAFASADLKRTREAANREKRWRDLGVRSANRLHSTALQLQFERRKTQKR